MPIRSWLSSFPSIGEGSGKQAGRDTSCSGAAEANMDLDQNEVDDAKEDLTRAGGSLADRIQSLRNEHEETANSALSSVPTGPPPEEQRGLCIAFSNGWRCIGKRGSWRTRRRNRMPPRRR